MTLDRLHQDTRLEEEECIKKNGGDPFILAKQAAKSRGGVAERYIKVIMKQITSKITLKAGL